MSENIISNNVACGLISNNVERLFEQLGFTHHRMQYARLLYLYLQNTGSPISVHAIKENYGGDPLRVDGLLFEFESIGLVEVVSRTLLGGVHEVRALK